MLVLTSLKISRRGLTLIELLISIAIAILVCAVAFTIYNLMVDTFASQGAWRGKVVPSMTALDRLQADIACMYVPEQGVAETPLLLQPASNRFLCFFSAEDCSRTNISRVIYKLHYLEYMLEKCEPSKEYALIRTSFSATGAEKNTPAREEILRGIQSVELQLYDGRRWTNYWDGSSETLPKAARISLVLTGGKTIDTQVLIPAGCEFAPAD